MNVKPGRKRTAKDSPPALVVHKAIANTPKYTVSDLWTNGLGRTAIRAVQILILLLLSSVVVVALLQLSLIALPVLLALIITSALWPLVKLLRKVMSALLAAWVVFLGALLVLGGIGTALVYSVAAELPTLIDKGVEGFHKLQGMVNQLPWSISQEQIDQVIKQVTDFLTSSQFGAGALNSLSAAGNFVTGLVLLLVILFFFLKDGDKIWAFFVSWTPLHQRHRWLSTGDRTIETLGGYVRGTSTIAAVDAAAITIALLVLKVPLAIPLGVVTFLAAFIPMVGATVAGALATLIALVTNGPVTALIVLGAVILIQQLEGNFLQPIVMAHALNLHALVILLSLAAGTVLGGLVGAVLAVPLTAVGWSITKIWAERNVVTTQLDDDLPTDAQNPDSFPVSAVGKSESTDSDTTASGVAPTGKTGPTPA